MHRLLQKNAVSFWIQLLHSLISIQRTLVDLESIIQLFCATQRSNCHTKHMRYCKQVVPPTHITIHNPYVHNSSFASPKKFTTQCQASVQPPLTQLLQPTVVLVVQRPQAVGVKLTEICEDISKVSLVSGIFRSIGFNCELSRRTGC